MLLLFFLLFIAVIIFSQYRIIIAAKQLTERERLFEANFSMKQQLIYLITILGGIIFIILVPHLLSWLLFFIVIILLGTYIQIYKYRCLKADNFTQSYLKPMAIYSSITFLAEIGVFVCFFLST